MRKAKEIIVMYIAAQNSYYTENINIKHMLTLTRQTRANFLSLMNGLSEEQLNHMPTGFNNNMIWNFVHIIVTQQLLTYGLSKLPLNVDSEHVDAFRKGSKPVRLYTMSEIEAFKNLAVSTLDQFERDVEEGKFQTFKTYPTSFGIELKSLEEAIAFNNVHEALHLGYAMSLKRNL
jgi:hypothetical protein